VLNNDIEDLLCFQATVHLRRETTTANTLADMGGSDNFIARSYLRRLREAGVTIEIRTEGLMEVCTAGKRSLSETMRRDRVRVEFGIGLTYKSELWFTVYDLEDYDLILGKPWFRQHNHQHTIDYVKNMMWIEDERGQHVLEGLPPMTWEREKEAQRLGLQTIRWKEVQREMRHGRALGWSRDLQWDHGHALETSRDQGKRGARDTEDIEGARDSSKKIGARDTEDIEGAHESRKRGAHDTEEGARDAKKSCAIHLFMMRLSTPQLEGAESDALEAEMRRLYPETFEPHTGVPKRKPHDLQIRLREGAKPFHTTPYRVTPLEDEEMQSQLRVLADGGWITDSHSPFAAPMIFVKKADGSLGLCVDFRPLNADTLKDRYPLPHMEDLLNEVHGSSHFTKLDLQSDYHQMRLRKEDRWKTAITTKYGLFEWTVVPFGLANAPSAFMRTMIKLLAKH
jgi:hypothetical protein